MVYFIQGEQTKRIKIGRTTSVINRLQSLQSGSPDKLIVLKVLVNAKSDAEYHAQFRDDQVYGEWFKPSEDLLAFIAGLPESKFDGLTYAPRNSSVEVIKRQSHYTPHSNPQLVHETRQSTMDRCYRWRVSQGLVCCCGHHDILADPTLTEYVQTRLANRGEELLRIRDLASVNNT